MDFLLGKYFLCFLKNFKLVLKPCFQTWNGLIIINKPFNSHLHQMFDAAFIEHLLLSSFLAKCCIKGERLDLAKTVINLQKEVKKKNSCFKSNNKKSLLWNVKTDVNYNKVLLIHGGGICDRVVNTSNSRSGGLGFKPRPLHCILRQGTLPNFVSLHPSVSMGTSDILLGGNPAID